MDHRDRPARASGTGGRIATLGFAVLLALVVGCVGGIVLYLLLGLL